MESFERKTFQNSVQQYNNTTHIIFLKCNSLLYIYIYSFFNIYIYTTHRCFVGRCCIWCWMHFQRFCTYIQSSIQQKGRKMLFVVRV